MTKNTIIKYKLECYFSSTKMCTSLNWSLLTFPGAIPACGGAPNFIFYRVISLHVCFLYEIISAVPPSLKTLV